MDEIKIPDELLPKNIKSPAAFIADKHPELPDYGIDTGDLVIVDSGMEFVKGELSAFQDNIYGKYRLSKEKLRGFMHFGKVVTVMKYFGKSPFHVNK